MKKLLLATFALMVLSACSNNPKPDGPLGTSRDFVLGVMSNNAGLQIPNVFAQSGEHYVLARFFGKDTSVLCSNLTGKDVCYDPKGSVIGESDTKLQLTFGRAIVGRALAKEQKLTEANGMHFDVPDIAGKEFTSSEMLPAVFQGIAFPKKSVRAQSCEKRTTETAEEITCTSQTLMPYYAYVQKSSGQHILVSESMFFYGEGVTKSHLESMVQSYLPQ